MSLVEFFFHSDNVIFTSAIVLMIFIAILEGLMVVIGSGISSMLDPLIPDFDVDVDMNAEIESSSFALSKFFSWIRVKQVPVLMLLIIFLMSFGVVGLIFQAILLNLLSTLWFGWIIAIPTFIISLINLRIFGGIIAKILPKDETSSISSNELIGHIATITLGNAKKGSPAEAKTKDTFGQTHYFMVEPEDENTVFKQGDEVLLIQKINTHFLATNQYSEKLK